MLACKDVVENCFLFPSDKFLRIHYISSHSTSSGSSSSSCRALKDFQVHYINFLGDLLPMGVMSTGGYNKVCWGTAAVEALLSLA